jgi:putative tricarboxylic transport membrane protein
MSEHSPTERSAASTRTMELVVATALFVMGAVVIYDSTRLGWKWADDGPEAGYFPFYIGLAICIASTVIFFRGAANAALARRMFVSREQLAMVFKLLIPSVLYVAAIQFVGIYIASTVFIAFFMRWLGRYSWLKTVPVALGVSVVFFLLFEIWFRVPLPKGPLEAALGLN